MFDFSKAQEITDEMIKLQNELKFQEAANLYLKTINEIQSSEFQAQNQTEWIENLLDKETTLILLGLN
jgi:polyhydroxyalkanoate synthesis regulator phasin